MPTPNESLRRERQLRGWSQVHLAEQIGVPDYYISRWERGDVFPSPYYQQKLCEVFGKTAEELGMLQARHDASQRIQKVESSSPLAPGDHLPLIEQLPFPQPEIQPSLHDSDTSTTERASTPVSLTQRGKQLQLPRRRRFLALLALILLISTSIGLGTFFLLPRINPEKADLMVGHLYFLSSGQTSDTSSQGIADEVQMKLPFLPDPSVGKSYQEGVDWIYQTIQSLAIIDIMPYKS